MATIVLQRPRRQSGVGQAIGGLAQGFAGGFVQARQQRAQQQQAQQQLAIQQGQLGVQQGRLGLQREQFEYTKEQNDAMQAQARREAAWTDLERARQHLAEWDKTEPHKDAKFHRAYAHQWERVQRMYATHLGIQVPSRLLRDPEKLGEYLQDKHIADTMKAEEKAETDLKLERERFRAGTEQIQAQTRAADALTQQRSRVPPVTADIRGTPSTGMVRVGPDGQVEAVPLPEGVQPPTTAADALRQDYAGASPDEKLLMLRDPVVQKDLLGAGSLAYEAPMPPGASANLDAWLKARATGPQRSYPGAPAPAGPMSTDADRPSAVGGALAQPPPTGLTPAGRTLMDTGRLPAPPVSHEAAAEQMRAGLADTAPGARVPGPKTTWRRPAAKAPATQSPEVEALRKQAWFEPIYQALYVNGKRPSDPDVKAMIAALTEAQFKALLRATTRPDRR